jgi:hypothetical protein
MTADLIQTAEERQRELAHRGEDADLILMGALRAVGTNGYDQLGSHEAEDTLVSHFAEPMLYPNPEDRTDADA